MLSDSLNLPGCKRARAVPGWLPVLCLLIPCSLVSAWAAEAERVVHQLSFPELHQQYVRIISRFPVHSPDTELVMANWNPGSYLIRDFAGELDRLDVRDQSGAPLPWRKVRKNAWAIDAGEAEFIDVEYSVHGGRLSVNTSWVSPDFVLLNPASILLYSEPTRSLLQHVAIDVPSGMGQVQTALRPADPQAGWQAQDFDELVDSPVVISADEPVRFRQDGHDYRLLNVGNDALWDSEQAAADIQAMVGATNRFWGDVPLERAYWFMNFLVEKSGGLEHDHGTVMMASRWQMRQRDDYIKWLSLAAHEYFHVWNVRTMRPAAIETYDYETEQYSGALWLAEGVSSYYDNLILSRARRVSPDEYFKRLALDLHRLELTPGRHFISLEAASRDAWIRHYQPDANSINSTVSYYTKGAVVAFVLDTRIRARSGGRNSLDDVMREMYARWGGRGYPDGAFRRAVEAIAGTETRAWLEPLISTPADPDIDAALDHFGLVLNRHPEQAAAAAAGIPVSAGFGVNWDRDSERLVIGAVVSGMAGARVGLLPGDELLAINGERVLKDNFDDRMQRLRPGEQVELLLSRQQQIKRLTLTLDVARPTRYEIMVQPDINRRHLRRLEDWLGQDLQFEKG